MIRSPVSTIVKIHSSHFHHFHHFFSHIFEIRENGQISKSTVQYNYLRNSKTSQRKSASTLTTINRQPDFEDMYLQHHQRGELSYRAGNACNAKYERENGNFDGNQTYHQHIYQTSTRVYNHSHRGQKHTSRRSGIFLRNEQQQVYNLRDAKNWMQCHKDNTCIRTKQMDNCWMLYTTKRNG
jgi:hypothetical protein